MLAVEVYAAVWRFVFTDGNSRREAVRGFRLSRETVTKMCRFSLPPGYTRRPDYTRRMSVAEPMLVRSVDRHHAFDVEPRPRAIAARRNSQPETG